MKSPPILTCSVIKDGVLFAVNRLRWIKGGKELAQTRVSARLVFDIAISPTTFGLYMCEAINDQSIAQNSILIAERGILLCC